MRYLLDTAIVGDLVRHPRGAVAKRIAEVGETLVCTSIVVAAELRWGAGHRGAARLAAQLEAVLRAIEVVPLEPPVDAVYGALRVRLEEIGDPLGANDLFVAAHALALRCTLVTGDERAFSRIKALPVESWLR